MNFCLSVTYVIELGCELMASFSIPYCIGLWKSFFRGFGAVERMDLLAIKMRSFLHALPVLRDAGRMNL